MGGMVVMNIMNIIRYSDKMCFFFFFFLLELEINGWYVFCWSL